MFAAYQSAMFTADTAANEVDTISSAVAAEFWVTYSSEALRRFTVAGRVKSGLHRLAQVYTPGAPMSQECCTSVVVTEPTWARGLPLSSVQHRR